MNEETHVYLNKLEKTIQHYFVKALIHLKLPIINLNIGIHGSGGRKSTSPYQQRRKARTMVSKIATAKTRCVDDRQIVLRK